MSKTGLRDVLLIGAIVALIAVALINPGREGEEEEGAAADRPMPQAMPGAADTAPRAAPSMPGMGAALPLKTARHRFWPLVAGSRWVYHVSGPREIVPSNEWTIEVVAAPAGDEPAELRAGYGTDLSPCRAWLQGEALRTDAWPFIEPAEYFGNRPTRVTGVFLPDPAVVVGGAVWGLELDRTVPYRFRDGRGRPREVAASARQRDRAQAGEEDDVIVPAGRFTARRIEWLSRIQIEAQGRPVLVELAAEPYRRESMWVSEGTGIVKRRITFPAYRAAEIAFDLVRYERPGAPLSGQ